MSRAIVYPHIVQARCDHNFIPCSRWFRIGWVCVRCHRWLSLRAFRRYVVESGHFQVPTGGSDD